MRGCWTDGELRAYVDRELPERDRVAAHLEKCGECRARHTAIAERAVRVSALMSGLGGERVVVQRAPRRVRRAVPVWMGAAGSIAALLAAGFLMLPRLTPIAVPPPPPHADHPVLSAQAGGGPALTTQAAGRRHVVKARRPRSLAVTSATKTAEDVKYFLALDDEPIDTGMMMRVALDDGNVQADVIVGPDGRARAVRLVN